MSWLEHEGVEAVRKKAQRYVRDLVSEAVTRINTHTTAELEKHMADINASLDRLSGAISTEIQQVRDELQGIIDNLGEENADLRAQLEAQVSSLTSAAARVDSMSSDLEANDPAPVEETDPGVEPPEPTRP
jgi:septal ring factor EnvC (AmiA/AmiB activator)